ncbi:Phosphatidylinositol-4-phosphate 5-kinase [Entophlyctis luteolus]|nr:Phosphatidylinositol-4-phosphate 5-kinase [Entophlyctis luteolus]
MSFKMSLRGSVASQGGGGGGTGGAGVPAEVPSGSNRVSPYKQQPRIYADDSIYTETGEKESAGPAVVSKPQTVKSQYSIHSIGRVPNIGRQKSGSTGKEVLVGTPIKQGHVNYMVSGLPPNLSLQLRSRIQLMYDMLTGIRISVGRCSAKPKRDVADDDFVAAHKLAFDVNGTELTPKSGYDFKFKDYAPWIFRLIRECFHVDAQDYLQSLTGKYVLSELGSPGKSGSFFYFSQDYRFIIKTISKAEHVFCRRILRSYYEVSRVRKSVLQSHVLRKHVKANPDTLLSRILGLHRVKQPGNRKIHFVVMGNVFPASKDMHETYDLKGSLVGRGGGRPGMDCAGVVLKDLDWLERGRKISLGSAKRDAFVRQMEIDVAVECIQPPSSAH